MSLLTALKSGDERLVETICVSGASPNSLEDGASAMHIAVGMRDCNALKLTKVLLQYGGDPNVEDEEKLTPTHVAVIQGNAKILQLLLRNGGDPTRKDDEGRDAWDYAQKYCRQSCQRILSDYMDEDTLTDSDSEQNKFISIFIGGDKPVGTTHRLNIDEVDCVRGGDTNRLSSSSELNRGFVRSSFGSVVSHTPSPNQNSPDNQLAIISEESPQKRLTCSTAKPLTHDSKQKSSTYPSLSPPTRDTPRPPPRRSKSIRSPPDAQLENESYQRCSCAHQTVDITQYDRSHDRSHDPHTDTNTDTHSHQTTHQSPAHRLHQAVRDQSHSSSKPTPLQRSPSKRAAGLLASLKKSLSPATKSTDSSRRSSSQESSPKKAKQRPTLAIRKSSPGSRAMVRQSSHHTMSVSSAVEEARRRLLRSNSTPSDCTPAGGLSTPSYYTPAAAGKLRLSERDRQLLHAGPLLIDATSPDNVVITPQPARNKDQGYSPSNYKETNAKPDKEKKVESPFQKFKRKNGKSLWKRILAGPPASPDCNNESVRNLGHGQTLELCDRDPLDTNSQLSIEIPATPKVSNTTSSADCNHCNSTSSMDSTKTSESCRTIASREMVAIQQGLKVFDATSPDHCVVVERGPSHPSPLDKTICYEGPSFHPRRLEFSPKNSTFSPAAASKSRSHSPLTVRSQSNSPQTVQSRANSPAMVRSRANSPVSVRSQAKSPVTVGSRANSPVTLRSQAKSHVMSPVGRSPVMTRSKPVPPVRTSSIKNSPKQKTQRTVTGLPPRKPPRTFASLDEPDSNSVGDEGRERPKSAPDERATPQRRDCVQRVTPERRDCSERATPHDVDCVDSTSPGLAVELENKFREMQRRFREPNPDFGQSVAAAGKPGDSSSPRGSISAIAEKSQVPGDKKMSASHKKLTYSSSSETVTHSTPSSSQTVTNTTPSTSKKFGEQEEETSDDKYRLTHRWSGRRQRLVKQNSTVSEGSDPALTNTQGEMMITSAAVRQSTSKDSGIESNLTSSVRRKTGRVSSESDESFHTCASCKSTKATAKLPARELERDISPKSYSPPSDSAQPLPTEMDTLQAKVSRMKLDEFEASHSSDSDEVVITEKGDQRHNASKSVSVRAASICASDGSVAEYLHTDLETDITLCETRYPITCTAASGLNTSRRSIDWRTFSRLSDECSQESVSADSVAPVVIPRDILYLSDAALHKELTDLGDVPGPIMSATRRIYQLRLVKLRENPDLCTPSKLCGFSRELQQYITSHSSVSHTQISRWLHDLVSHFEVGGRKWREGNSKMSFTYLLLDPRTTKNLPARHHLLDSENAGEAFRVFLSSVFYIGKGKKTRPYQHFIDAIRRKNNSEKTKQIIDIWKSDRGVVSLHVYHNIIPVEAFTREACMVEAIGLKNLTNVAHCNYYGISTTWDIRKKRLVGSDLLRKAFSILLIEGERQIRPADIRDESELPSFLV